MNNEAAFMKVSADRKYKPNLKFHLENLDYVNGNGIIELHALRNIKAYESLVIHPTEGHNNTFLEQATHDTALYIETFFYRGVPY